MGTRPSIWVGVVSVILTAFTAFPSWPSMAVHVFNVLLLYVMVALARREGASVRDEHFHGLMQAIKKEQNHVGN